MLAYALNTAQGKDTIRASDTKGLRVKFRDNLTFFNKNFCDPSLEPSCKEGSNEWSQHALSLSSKKDYH